MVIPISLNSIRFECWMLMALGRCSVHLKCLSHYKWYLNRPVTCCYTAQGPFLYHVACWVYFRLSANNRTLAWITWLPDSARTHNLPHRDSCMLGIFSCICNPPNTDTDYMLQSCFITSRFTPGWVYFLWICNPPNTDCYKAQGILLCHIGI